MFGSTIIDTVIGVVFVFLLVSLLVTIANEMIAGILRSRAKWLRFGIERMLGTAWAQNLYNHPLVYGTAGTGQPQAGTSANQSSDDPAPTAPKRFGRGQGPSYIPSRSFANVLVDLIRDSNAAVTKARTTLQTTLDQLHSAPDIAALKDALGKAAAAIVADEAASNRVAGDVQRLAESLPPTVGAALVEIQKFIDSFPARYLREAITAIQNTQVREALLALYDDAQNDVEQFKQNLEIWFNNAMDRIGGWYKRRAQFVTFLLGLFLSVAINVDAINVAVRLHTDPGVRQALVAEAAAFARNAPPEVQGAPDGNAQVDPKELEKRFSRVKTELEALDLPIGWPMPVSEKKPAAGSAGKGSTTAGGEEAGWWCALWNIVREHGFGWLITALAATLGAPFWFDTLNRLMSIRSAGKAPEEAPKPPKEVPEPLEPGKIPVR